MNVCLFLYFYNKHWWNMVVLFTLLNTCWWKISTFLNSKHGDAMLLIYISGDVMTIQIDRNINRLMSWLFKGCSVPHVFLLGCSDSPGMRQTFSCLSKLGGTTNLIRFLFGHVKEVSLSVWWIFVNLTILHGFFIITRLKIAAANFRKM